jgi:hypothetical protein
MLETMKKQIADQRMVTETERLPLEVEGLQLLSDEGLRELREFVDQEITRRQIAIEKPK